METDNHRLNAIAFGEGMMGNPDVFEQCRELEVKVSSLQSENARLKAELEEARKKVVAIPDTAHSQETIPERG